MVDVGVIGDVDYKRGDGSGIGRVAAKEGGMGIQAEVDNGILIGDGGKSRVV